MVQERTARKLRKDALYKHKSYTKQRIVHQTSRHQCSLLHFASCHTFKACIFFSSTLCRHDTFYLSLPVLLPCVIQGLLWTQNKQNMLQTLRELCTKSLSTLLTPSPYAQHTQLRFYQAEFQPGHFLTKVSMSFLC
jgi:hypothetical protein